MNAFQYLKKNGIKHTINIIYAYKIDIIIRKILGVVLKKRPLQDIIVIESHNDFDSNGGAFYNYLIKNGYNRKYKIVWAIKHPETVPQSLPENVTWYAAHKPGIKKNYYKWIAKYFTSDNDCSAKLRDNQKAIYFGHGGFGLKNCKGYIKLPEKLDYVAMPSKYLKNIFSDQLMLASNDPRLCYIGFPYVDNFYDGKEGDLHKITMKTYQKVILWMPTFRKGGGYNRQDSETIGDLGIPLIYNMSDYYKLNEFLRENNSFLILKIHPMQDIENLRIKSTSNICVLTGNDVKRLMVDNYRLMKDCDALISDYSSAAYDFLQCNKPIAYDFSDIQGYKVGLSVKNPEDYMAGHYIKDFNDMISFISDILNGVDCYYEKRQILRNKIFDYYDGNNSQRAAKLLGI
mgnify:FL=1